MRNKGDLTPFVIQFLEIIVEAFEQLINALQKRRNDLHYYQSRIKSIDLLASDKYYPLTDLLLQATLFSFDGITIKNILAYARISDTTLRKRLTQFDRYGILNVHIDGREKYYQLDLEQLEALTKHEA